MLTHNQHRTRTQICGELLVSVNSFKVSNKSMNHVSHGEEREGMLPEILLDNNTSCLICLVSCHVMSCHVKGSGKWDSYSPMYMHAMKGRYHHPHNHFHHNQRPIQSYPSIHCHKIQLNFDAATKAGWEQPTAHWYHPPQKQTELLKASLERENGWRQSSNTLHSFPLEAKTKGKRKSDSQDEKSLSLMGF